MKGIVCVGLIGAIIFLSSWQTSPLAATMARGKAVYKKTCIACHQADGGGVQNLNPPLIETEYVTGNKTRLIIIVLKGFKERVEIDGDTYGNDMPPVPLTDQQTADVLTYVRKSFGNKASAVTLAEVKASKVKKIIVKK
jgi:mono/diheme cytochrome c family protein